MNTHQKAARCLSTTYTLHQATIFWETEMVKKKHINFEKKMKRREI